MKVHEKEEFNQMVLDVQTPLMNYALQLTQDGEDAKDLVQETMYKAIAYRQKFSEGTNLKGWLFTIMKNSFINNYRKIVRRNMFVDTTSDTYLMEIPSHVAENNAWNNILGKDLEMAINQLPEDLKITFNYNREGYKYQEIADLLDIPIGTVKTRIFVAKRKLRKKLKSYAEAYNIKEK